MRFRLIPFPGWVLVGLVLLAPTAHAGLVQSATDTVQKVVEPVTGPGSPTKPPVVPKTPSLPAPSPPPVEDVVKPVGEVAETATNTVRGSDSGGSAGSGSGSSGSGTGRSGGSADGNSGGGDGARGSGYAATRGGSGGLVEPGRGPGSGPGAPGAPGAGGGNTGLERRHTSGPAGSGSIFSARPAPDPRFSAYVWPAVALGGAASVILAAMDVPVGAGAIPLSTELPRVLAAAAVLEAVGPESAMPTTPSPDFSDPNPLPYSPGQLPDSNEIWFILLLLLCLAPLTLFAYTIRREVKSLSRWPHA